MSDVQGGPCTLRFNVSWEMATRGPPPVNRQIQVKTLPSATSLAGTKNVDTNNEFPGNAIDEL